MTTKKKEQAKVVSQEQLADGIFSMWIQTETAGSARPGQFISMYTNDGSKVMICRLNKMVRIPIATSIKKVENFVWFTV